MGVGPAVVVSRLPSSIPGPENASPHSPLCQICPGLARAGRDLAVRDGFRFQAVELVQLVADGEVRDKVVRVFGGVVRPLVVFEVERVGARERVVHCGRKGRRKGVGGTESWDGVRYLLGAFRCCSRSSLSSPDPVLRDHRAGTVSVSPMRQDEVASLVGSHLRRRP